MNAQNDLDQQLNSFLREGPEELPSESFDAVRDRTEQTRQRVIIGPWRTPTMNKLLTYGLGAAAVVVLVFAGSQFFGSSGGLFGTQPTPTPEPTAEPTPEPTPTSSPGVPVGDFLVFDPTIQPPPFSSGPAITVTIASSGWTHLPENGILLKGDQADPPEGTGAGLLTGDTGADTFYVYGDPCHWESTTPDAPATAVDEIVAALAAQASRDATAPVDVTVGGFSGKHITLHVPDTGATRDEAFKDCDQETFATYGIAKDGPSRYQQGPGQVDEFWILNVNDKIVVLDASYSPATPAALVDELRALAESATFDR